MIAYIDFVDGKFVFSDFIGLGYCEEIDFDRYIISWARFWDKDDWQFPPTEKAKLMYVLMK